MAENSDHAIKPTPYHLANLLTKSPPQTPPRDHRGAETVGLLSQHTGRLDQLIEFFDSQPKSRENAELADELENIKLMQGHELEKAIAESNFHECFEQWIKVEGDKRREEAVKMLETLVKAIGLPIRQKLASGGESAHEALRDQMDHLLEIFNQPATHKHVDKGSQETPRKTVVQLCESVNLLKKQAPQLCELFRDGGKTLESEQLTRLENGMILFERLRNVQPRNARKPDFDRASELLKTLNEMAVEAVACGSDEGQASASEIPRNPRIQWNPESMPERMSSKKQRSVTKHQFEQNAQKMVSQDVKLNGIRIKNGEELTVTILPHEWETPYGKPGFELESVSDVSVATAGLMDQTWDQDQSKVTWRDGDRWAGVRPIARVRRGVDDKSAELMRNVQGYGKIREGMLLVEFNRIQQTIQDSSTNSDEAVNFIHQIQTAIENQEEVTLLFVTPVDIDKNNHSYTEGHLAVWIIEGENMPKMDWDGAADPYCFVHFGKEKHRQTGQTETCLKNLNPQWNDIFLFDINHPMQELTNGLNFEVWDYDKYSSNEPIGKASLNLRDAWEQCSQTHEKGNRDPAFKAPDGRECSTSPPPSGQLTFDVYGSAERHSRTDQDGLAIKTDYVGSAVNSEFCSPIACWYLETKLELKLSNHVFKKSKQPARIHIGVQYEGINCPKLVKDDLSLLSQHDFRRTVRRLSEDIQFPICSEHPASFAAGTRAQLTWHYDKMISDAFTILDTQRCGKLTGAQLYRVFLMLGEKIDLHELADIIGVASLGPRPINDRAHPSEVDIIFTKVDRSGFARAIEWLALKNEDDGSGGMYPGGRHYKACSVKSKTMDQLFREQWDDFSLPDFSLPFLVSHQNYAALPRNRRNGYELWKLLIRRLEIVLLVRKWSDDSGIRYSSANAQISPNSAFVRDPEGTVSTYWNVLQLILLLYVTVTVPYNIAFDIDEKCGFSFWIEVLIDAYFVIDIMLNFRTQYTDKNGNVITGSKRIAAHYAKGWLLIDVLSCVSMIGYFMPGSDCEGSEAAGSLSGESGYTRDGARQTANSTKVAKVLRIVRISKLLRVARLQRALAKLNFSVDIGPAIKFAVLAGMSVLMFHWLSCLWYFIGSSDEDGWPYHAGYVEFGAKYAASLFTAVYGAIDSPTNVEMFGLVANHFVLNGLVYGMLTASLASTLVSLTASSQRYNERMDGVHEWMRVKGISAKLKGDVIDFYTQKYSERKVFDELVMFKELQPSPLAKQLVREVYSNMIGKVPFIKGLEATTIGEEIVAQICLLLRTMPALAQRPVYCQGDIASEMYIVLKGSLQVTFCSNRIDRHCNEQAKSHYEMMRISGRSASFFGKGKEGWIDWDDGKPFSAYAGNQELSAVPATRKTFAMQKDRLAPLQVESDQIVIYTDFDVEKGGATGNVLRKGDIIEVSELSLRAHLIDAMSLSARSGVNSPHIEQNSSESAWHRVNQVLEVRTGDVLGYLGDSAYFGESALLSDEELADPMVAAAIRREYDWKSEALESLRNDMERSSDSGSARSAEFRQLRAEVKALQRALSVASMPDLARREETVTAMTNCDLVYLLISDMQSLKRQFPELKSSLQKYAKMRSKLEEPRKMFHLIDKDGDGALDRNEFFTLLVRLGIETSFDAVYIVLSGSCARTLCREFSEKYAMRHTREPGTDPIPDVLDRILQKEIGWDYVYELPLDRKHATLLDDLMQWLADDEKYMGLEIKVYSVDKEGNGKTQEVGSLSVPPKVDQERERIGRLLRTLQDSNIRVDNLMDDLDRDRTQKLEYDEFLSWWIMMTSEGTLSEDVKETDGSKAKWGTAFKMVKSMNAFSIDHGQPTSEPAKEDADPNAGAGSSEGKRQIGSDALSTADHEPSTPEPAKEGADANAGAGPSEGKRQTGSEGGDVQSVGTLEDALVLLRQMMHLRAPERASTLADVADSSDGEETGEVGDTLTLLKDDLQKMQELENDLAKVKATIDRRIGLAQSQARKMKDAHYKKV